MEGEIRISCNRLFLAIAMLIAFFFASNGLYSQGSEPAASSIPQEKKSYSLFTELEAGPWVGWNGKSHPITRHIGVTAGMNMTLGPSDGVFSLRPVVGVGYLNDEKFRAYILAGVLGKLSVGNTLYFLLGPTYQTGTGEISMGNLTDHFETKQFFQSLCLNTGIGINLSQSLFVEFQWRVSANKTNYYVYDNYFKAWRYESRHSIFALSVGYFVL